MTSNLPAEMQAKAIREGIQSATLAGEARQEAEKILSNPFADWDDLRQLTPIFMDGDSVRVVLDGISQLEQVVTFDGRRLRPQDCPNFMAFFKDIYYQQLQIRAQHGKSSISSVGWIRGAKRGEGRSWHRIASGNAFLVQGFKGGMDATWWGIRGIGKSDGCLHYYAVPYLEMDNWAVSGINIANKDDWPKYKYCSTNADLLIECCNIIITHLKNNDPTIQMPNIMVIRDDISASGVSRKRAGSEALFNLECLGMITRHFGIGTVWIFQYMLSIPTTIREATTRWIHKTNLKSLTSTIEWSTGTEITRITGLQGLDDRKEGGMPYLDYDCHTPQITVDNLPMNDAMMYVNYKDRNQELSKLERFEGFRDYLVKLLALSSADRQMTQEDIIRSVVWLYVEGKKNKKLKSVGLTQSALAKVADIPYGTVRKAIEAGVSDWEKNPDRWKPLLSNKKEQRDVISRALQDSY